MRYAVILILLFSSAVYAERIAVTEFDIADLNDLLDLGYENRENLKLTGYYNQKGQALDGDFKLISYQSLFALDHPSEWLDSVIGGYRKNKKHGDWIYRHIENDALDVYASFTVVISFENGKCIKSHFFGGIGHSMKNKVHIFRSPELCTLNSVIRKSWELWSVEFEDSQ